MKKFILIIVFVFLIAILISFNYLLWDREKQLASFQNISDSKNLTIETLSEKMNSLDNLNKELNKKVDTITADNTAIRDNLAELNTENVTLKTEVALKNNLIAQFKGYINVAPMDAVIKKWVEYINSKNYKSAQALISPNSSDLAIKDTEKFKDLYQNEVKALRIKTSKLFTEMKDDEHLGKIQLKVILEVDKPDSTDENKDKIPQELFKSGDNERYITMEFNADTNEWLILEITEKP